MSIKKVLIIFLLIAITTLSGCVGKKDAAHVPYEEKPIVEEPEDVFNEASISNIEAKRNGQVNFLLTNNGDKTFSYLNPFVIAGAENGQWEITTLSQELFFTMDIIKVGPGESKTISFDLSPLKMKFVPNKKYRLIRSVFMGEEMESHELRMDFTSSFEDVSLRVVKIAEIEKAGE